MDIELKKESTITEELPCGSTLKAVIDHLDSERSVNLVLGGRELGWMAIKDLNAVKKVINKAISLHKGG